MPLATAVAILAVLVVLGQLGGVAALAAMVTLLTAAAFWPLDASVSVDVLAKSPAPTDQAPDIDRKGWRAVVDAIPTAALALDGAGCVVHHNRLITDEKERPDTSLRCPVFSPAAVVVSDTANS